MSSSPNPFQRILVATDFSEHSAAALKQAVSVARVFGGEVVVAHVMTHLRRQMAEMPADARWQLVAGDIEKFEHALSRSSDEKLRAVLTEHQSSGVPLRYETLMGTPFAELIHAVQQQGYGMVFCGTRGQAAWKRLVLGSTADRLLRHSPCPVWIVKQGTEEPLRSILAPVDFSPTSRQALELAGMLAARTGARLHVLHVVDASDVPDLPEEATQFNEPQQVSRRQVNKVAREHLDSFLAEALPQPPELDRHIGHGDPWRTIGTTARRISADLLVMGTVGRTGVPGLLLGSTAERVLHNFGYNVLAAKPPGFVSSVQPAFWPLPQPEPR